MCFHGVITEFSKEKYCPCCIDAEAQKTKCFALLNQDIYHCPKCGRDYRIVNGHKVLLSRRNNLH